MEPTEPTSSLSRLVDALNGAVRPVLAFAFGGTLIYSAISGNPLGEGLMGIAAMVIGFFYQSRSDEKVAKRIEAQQDQLVELAKAVPTEPHRGGL